MFCRKKKCFVQICFFCFCFHLLYLNPDIRCTRSATAKHPFSLLRFCLEHILLLAIFIKFRIIALNSIILIIGELRMQNLSLFSPVCRACGLLLLSGCWWGVGCYAEVVLGWRGSSLLRAAQGLMWRSHIGRSRVRRGKGGVTPRLEKRKTLTRVSPRACVSMGISHSASPSLSGSGPPWVLQERDGQWAIVIPWTGTNTDDSFVQNHSLWYGQVSGREQDPEAGAVDVYPGVLGTKLMKLCYWRQHCASESSWDANPSMNFPSDHLLREFTNLLYYCIPG